MRKHRGLTRGKSILFHGLQQLSAFLAFTCIAMLVFYSFTFVRTNNANYSGERILYDWNLFSEEVSFEETSTFDSMLMDSLQEIIRYNVAKSQLEVDGKFDGSKVIDVRAFVNRKDNLQSGLDIVPGFEDGSKEDVRNDAPTAEYYLEDLLKWERYGVAYEVVTMSEYDFVTYFGADYLQWYDVNPTEEQRETLNNAFGEKVTQLLIDRAFEIYGYEGMYTFDAKKESAAQIEAYEKVTENQAADIELLPEKTEQAESYEYYELAIYPTTVHLAFADLLLNGVPVNYTYVDDTTGEIMVEVLVLNERYQTADEQTLFSKVDSWEEYYTLVYQVRQAVSDLAYNYNEYLDFAEKYGTGATNIVYTFEMTMMGEQVLVSNLHGAEGASFDTIKLSAEELDEHFRTAYGRYMIYRPQTMTFESNTGIIEEDDLFEAFSNYEYAYPETAEIWLAVDTTYPVSDRFSQAADAYDFMHPYAYVVAVMGGMCIFGWLILFLFLSVMTGYRREKEEKEAVLTLSWVDSIPTEIAAVLSGGIGLGSFWAVIYVMSIIRNGFSGAGLDYICAHRMQVALLTGLLSMLGSAFFCICWYSLIRRIKTHTLWKKSLTYLLYRCTIGRLAKAVKKVAIKLYDNSSIAMRGILVLGGIVLFNFIMGAVFYRYRRAFIYYGGMVFILFALFILGVNGVALFCWVCSHEKRKKIIEGIGRIKDGEVAHQVDTAGLHGENLELAEAVNSIGEGIKNAVETSMKDERLKADLITNVSHDIKTPLTSIINYVDLLKREKIETEPVKGYIEILDAKSQRLKQLTDDLVEASKISSGNITLIMERINLNELIHQSLGEFSEKFEEKSLSIMESIGSGAVYIKADSRRIWRVIENLFGNIYKYALEGTRVYLDMLYTEDGRYVSLSLKNISAQPLNIQADELTERFIRGDVSRSTEGSGLGLSIAKNLTELQDGKFNIYLDGDLFKVTLTFPVYEEAIHPIME